MLKDPCGVRQRYFVGKIQGHFSSTPCFATRCLCYSQKALVDELETIKTQMGRKIDQKTTIVHGTLSKIPHRNSNYYPVKAMYYNDSVETASFTKKNIKCTQVWLSLKQDMVYETNLIFNTSDVHM
jgi:hypothetical protein